MTTTETAHLSIGSQDRVRPRPRLCRIKKVAHFSGYGFNLQTRSGSNGQFIGTVDAKSPAEAAGLRFDDRVVEVNELNMEMASHSQVVARIKQKPDEVTLLVVDKDTDDYYEKLNIRITEKLLRDDDEIIVTKNVTTEAEAAAEAEADDGQKIAIVEVAGNRQKSTAEVRVQAMDNELTKANESIESVPEKKSVTVSFESALASPKPRLCILEKVPDFVGFGFNLESRQTFGGQFIGKVDANSPAERAGLRPGDHLIEVNGANVEQETHTQVVDRIKQKSNEVTLLVVDSLTESHYRAKGLPILLAAADETKAQATAVNQLDSNLAPGVTATKTQESAKKPTTPKPKLCVVKRVATFDGLGFSLHSEKGCSGQFIGLVEAGSPAEAAGLSVKDKLIEVNGTNIENDSHAQVVARIKQFPEELTLLVADPVTVAFFRDRNINITADLLQDATDRSSKNGVHRNESLVGEQTAIAAPVSAPVADRTSVPAPAPALAPAAAAAVQVESTISNHSVTERSPEVTASNAQPTYSRENSSGSGNKAEILSLTAAQVRERLQQNNARVRVKQTDRSFKDKSAAFEML